MERKFLGIAGNDSSEPRAFQHEVLSCQLRSLSGFPLGVHDDSIEFLARVRIPESNGAIPGARSQRLAIRGKRQIVDVLVVSFQEEFRLSEAARPRADQ